jgi:hypothetical protein
VTTLTPGGKIKCDVFGFWENADDRYFTITGSHVNAARGHVDFGNYDLYIRDSEGRTTCVEIWTDEIKKFMDLLSVTRRVKGTVTGFRRSGDEIKLEYVNPEGEPDTFTFDISSVNFEWSYWVYRSRFPLDELRTRYLMLPLPKSYLTDLAVPDEKVYQALDEALEGRLGDSWWMEREDENPKSEAADLAYTFPKAA